MSTQVDIQRPAATLSGTAPVAMQRGRHNDRMMLAGLRVERRWLVRDRDKAGLAPDPPQPWRAESPTVPAEEPRRLGLAGATALVVGSIVGVGIFNLPTSLAGYGPITLVSLGLRSTSRQRRSRFLTHI